MNSTEPPSFLSPEFAANPYQTIAWMRENVPVKWVPELQAWFVTRFDDVEQLFHDPENVSSDRRVWEQHVRPPKGSYRRSLEDRSFSSMPPAEHARMRRIVAAAFTPSAVQRMEGQIQELILDFARPLKGRRGTVDLLNEFIDPIPNTVIARISGVPIDDEAERFRELAKRVLLGSFPRVDEPTKADAERAQRELSAWVRSIAMHRKAEPCNDLISDLLLADDSEGGLSIDEIVMLITGLIAAGSDTTVIAAIVMFTTLWDHPQVLEQLRGERERLPGAIKELLRFGLGGAGGIPRYAIRDFELRGVKIKKGQMLLLSFAGANRDPAVYADPDRLDLDRDHQKLLVFGHGPHYCLGAQLATTELSCMLSAGLDFIPEDAAFCYDLMQIDQNGRAKNLPIAFDD